MCLRVDDRFSVGFSPVLKGLKEENSISQTQVTCERLSSHLQFGFQNRSFVLEGGGQ